METSTLAQLRKYFKYMIPVGALNYYYISQDITFNSNFNNTPLTFGITFLTYQHYHDECHGKHTTYSIFSILNCYYISRYERQLKISYISCNMEIYYIFVKIYTMKC